MSLFNIYSALSGIYLTRHQNLKSKQVGQRTAKLALLLIKSIKYGIVQFLLYEYLEVQTVYIYQTFIVNN